MQTDPSSISRHAASGSQTHSKVRAVIADSDDETDLYRQLPRYPLANDMEVDAADPRVLAPDSDNGSSESLTTSRYSSPLEFPSSDDENMQGPTDMDLSEDEFRDTFFDLDPKALDLIPALSAPPNNM